MDTMAAIKQTFFQECEEQLVELESGLLALDGGTSEPDTINAVFRAVHSIKGGAGAFGLEQLVRFAHTFETSLDLVRSEKVAATRSILNTGGAGGIIDRDRTSGTVSGIKISTIDISALTDSTTDLATLDAYISAVDASLTDVTTAASDLGAVKTRINMQSDFVSNLMDAVTRGVGQLVDADMNQESTRLQALQVQQQLGVQSLSIANQSTQQILSLFKG